jgi:hypothetical protein
MVAFSHNATDSTAAKKFFAGQNPMGRRFRLENGTKLGDPVEIVGVVKDAKYVDLREVVHPTVYMPVRQAETRRSGPGSPLPELNNALNRLPGRDSNCVLQDPKIL